jgi:hypothetical protein
MRKSGDEEKGLTSSTVSGSLVQKEMWRRGNEEKLIDLNN